MIVVLREPTPTDEAQAHEMVVEVYSTRDHLVTVTEGPEEEGPEPLDMSDVEDESEVEEQEEEVLPFVTFQVRCECSEYPLTDEARAFLHREALKGVSDWFGEAYRDMLEENRAADFRSRN